MNTLPLDDVQMQPGIHVKHKKHFLWGRSNVSVPGAAHMKALVSLIHVSAGVDHWSCILDKDHTREGREV